MTLIKLDDAIAALQSKIVEVTDPVSDSAYNHGLIAAVTALRSLTTDDGWEDIATAPRDGTIIDLWVVGVDFAERYPDCYWSERHQQWHGIAEAIWPGNGEFVTMWRPLPAPPSE